MNSRLDIPKFALIGLIAALMLSLLNQWVAFSKAYDEEQEKKLEALAAPDITYADDVTLSIETAAPDSDSTADDSLPALGAETTDIDALSAPEILSGVTTSRSITVETDTLRVIIDRRGGDIVGVALLRHLKSLDSDEPFVLLERNARRTYIAQSGLIGVNGTDSRSGRAVFSASASEYRMEEGEPLVVNLFFLDPSGVRITKRYTFTPGDHLIDVSYLIDNRSDTEWKATFYSQINRDNSEDPGAADIGFGIQAYLGAATTNAEDPYKKISFADMNKSDYRNQQTGGWVAMLQHYFVSAWVPDTDAQHTYFTKQSSKGLNIIGFTGRPTIVSPGDTATIGAGFYAGPKDQYRLQEIAPHLDLTVDYGWLWWIAQPLYALLYFFATGDFHAFDDVFSIGVGVGNWGVAIIMLTIVIKLVFFQLSAASYRSMANMRRVQPKMIAIRDRYGDDKQAQSKAMMELYQKEKINPLGGCLPILIQMPVFIALYWALIESVELRHAPFFLWIDDLSMMDPWFVLPIIMGATMWFQQKLNPPPPDPMQAKIMQWMPIIFTFFFLWFPSGLVVYWISNNILSIAQQWVITRRIENADKA